jgi:hypothetical protein
MEVGNDAFISETYSDGFFISKFRHTKAIKDIVCGISQEEFELLLQLSAKALTTMKDSVKSIEYKEALEKEIDKHRMISEGEKTVLKESAGNALKELESKALKEADGLRRQIEELRGALLASEAGQQKMKEQMAMISERAEAAFKNSLAELGSQRESQYQKELARLQENHRQTIERMREDAKESMSRSDAHSRESLASMKATYAELEAKLRAAHEKTFVAVEKGKQGEKEFEELCAQHTTWGPLINTSKEEAATDRRCVIRGCSTMFEVKNYQNTIPTSEINKFLRDMKEHTEAPLGVFVSLHTGISKKSGNYIQTEWTDNSQLLIYISSFYTHSIPDTLDFIDSCATIAMTVYKARAKAQDSDGVGLLSRIELAKLSVTKELERVTECIDSLTRNKKELVGLVEKQFVDSRLQMSLMKTGLGELLGILLGKHEEEVVEVVKKATVSQSGKGRKKTVV